MVICLEQGADLHMAQLMPMPLTVSCFSKIQIGCTFMVPAHLGSPGKRAVKRVCVLLKMWNAVESGRRASRDDATVDGCDPGVRFTKYVTTILRLSYDNAKVTIDLRRTSNLQHPTKGARLFLGTIHLQSCKIVWDGVRKLAYDIPKRNFSTI